MNATLLYELGKEIWSNNTLKDILNITGNAIDAIIALKILYYDLEVGNNVKIIIGNVETILTADLYVKHIARIDCGTLNVPNYYNNFLDYEPYTTINIYLPYIGIKKLNTNDIINASINVIYYINVLDGSCTANIFISKKYSKSNVQALLYQFNGNCDISIPISASNNNNVINGFMSTITGIYNTNPSQTIKGFIDMHDIDIQRSGNIASSNGMYGSNIPYLIITRYDIKKPTSFNHNIGQTLEQTATLSNLKGFTIVQELLISNFTGTENEYNELITLLQQGVVF